ncbi:hypothetical protein PFISCL1PPCAC_17389, partial [Pristionchus fissidentatus]
LLFLFLFFILILFDHDRLIDGRHGGSARSHSRGRRDRIAPGRRLLQGARRQRVAHLVRPHESLENVVGGRFETRGGRRHGARFAADAMTRRSYGCSSRHLRHSPQACAQIGDAELLHLGRDGWRGWCDRCSRLRLLLQLPCLLQLLQ